MKKPSIPVQALFLFAALSMVVPRGSAADAPFDSGSNGSYGELRPPVGEVTEIELPPDGILHCTSVLVDNGAILIFKRNALNTPVYILATSNVFVFGTISVGGGSGTELSGGIGGPGGFDGGNPGPNPGAGFGPGAGMPGDNSRAAGGAGPGVHASLANLATESTNRGSIYGSPLLLIPIGGSGGGASTKFGGGGGGGAIVIASNTRIEVQGRINAPGGPSADANNVQNTGSGGSIRLVAPFVKVNGLLQTDLRAYPNLGLVGPTGRIRIDTLDRRSLTGGFSGSTSVGGLMTVFPNPMPRLDIVEAAGTPIAEGSGPVNLVLPFGASPNRTIKVQARNFAGNVPIQLVLTPEQGSPISLQGVINNATENPATATFNVTLPVNVLTGVNAYSR